MSQRSGISEHSPDRSSVRTTQRDSAGTESLAEQARSMAMAVSAGFNAHDGGDREAAIEQFAIVDRNQFQHLSRREATAAAEAYVDALFRKDEVELTALEQDGLKGTAVREADWSPVRAKFRERAGIVGMDQEYAVASTEGWREHKAGGDYWTPMMRAQMHEVRAAMQDSTYPDKDRYGSGGLGPEPARYIVGIELHDEHSRDRWQEAVDLMQVYFQRILEAHQ